MPFFETPRERHGREYLSNIDKIARNSEKREKRAREAENREWFQRHRDRAAANERAAKARRQANFLDLVGVAGFVGGLIHGAVKDRQANPRPTQQQGATAPTQQPQQPAGQPVQPATAADRGESAQGLHGAPTAAEGQGQPPITEPLVNSTEPVTRPFPWGVLSIIAGALFFFAPLTSIVGIVLGGFGWTYARQAGDARQVRLNQIGIGISVVVLGLYILLFIIHALLKAVGF